MNDSIQFVTPGDHRPLVYEGETDADGRWTDGVLRTENGDVSFAVENRIPRFSPDAATFYDDEKSRNEVFRKGGIDPDTFIEEHWEHKLKRPLLPDEDEERYRRIAATVDPIVEIGSGPGGGLASRLLEFNPEAHVIMCDLSLWVLRKWQQFARRKGVWPNLRFAQFDATRIPIASDSVPVVTSVCGITSSSVAKTPKEVFRILQPGGTFHARESVGEARTTSESPPDALELLHERFDWFNIDLRALLIDAGFEQLDVRTMSREAFNPGEGSLADFGEKHKLEMHMQLFRIEAVKP